MPRKKKNSEKWFETGEPLNWHKEEGQAKRRAAALSSRNGNYLRTARALQALANVTTDSETKRKARADALYFFMKHKQKRSK